MAFSTTEEIIDDIRQGKMVVIMDDEDRENEGDLIMAASCVKAEDINFMARYGRGLVCLTLTRERCEQLNLPLMVSDNESVHSTNFTVSIEAAKGVTTGISAGDRAVTIQAAVAKSARASDIVMPGHIFPLMAQPGGVMARAGHTEAGCDLTRLAGFEPGSVIVEILNEDGSMARRPDLEKFADEHGLKIGTIADLIHYRVENEKTIERVAHCTLPTEFGDFDQYAYLDATDNRLHMALVKGTLDPDKATLIRVHIMSTLCDLLGSTHETSGWPLRSALKRVAEEGSGVVVVLRKFEEPHDLIQQFRNYTLLEEGGELPEAKESDELREFGLGGQILSDLGVHKMRVLGHPRKMKGISGFDLEVVEYVSYE